MRPALLSLLALGCAERIPGIEVELHFEVTHPPPTPVQATLHLGGVGLVRCPSMADRLPSLVSSAWAHGGHSEPGHDDASTSVDLTLELTTAGARQLTTLTPLPDRWCGLTLEWTPAHDTGTTLFVEAPAQRVISGATRQTLLAFAPIELETPKTVQLVVLAETGPPLSGLDGTLPSSTVLNGVLASLSGVAQPQ